MAQNLFAVPQHINRFQAEITTGCNLACAGCQRTIGMLAKSWRNQHMKLDRFEKLLANAPQANVLILQGIGEPTLHPQLPEMIAAATASGKFGIISFNTNALFEDIAFYRRLQGLGLGHVSISVDSLTPETAERLRSGTDVALLRTAVAEIGALFHGNITLSIVLSRVNLPELASLLDELYGLGARMIEVQPLISYAETIEPDCLQPGDLAQAIAIIVAAKQRLPGLVMLPAAALAPNGNRCTRPFTAAYVTVEGYLTPCCTTNDVSLFGRTSLFEMSWAEAWAQPAVAEWTRRFYHADDAICHGCAFNPAKQAKPQLSAEAGIKLQMAGDLAGAERHFRTVLAQADTAESLHRMGVLALQQQNPAAALPFLQTAASLSNETRIAHNLASALADLGRTAEAISILQPVLTREPNYLTGIQTYARAIEQNGDAQAAANIYGLMIEKALNQRDDGAIRLGIAQLLRLDLDPANLIVAANQLRISGRGAWIIPVLQRFLARNPWHLEGRMTLACAALKVVYASTQDIDTARDAYVQQLEELDVLAQMLPGDKLAGFANSVGTAKPFFLAYQGKADTGLQRIYGKMVARIMQSRFPANLPQPAFGGRIRVGFASHYWWIHSVSKLFAGWVKHLDRSQFEVFVYQLGAQSDWMTQKVAGYADHYRDGDLGDAGWRETIAADQLHVLIYPEIGMHTTAVRLGALRLAPVQCVSWGHPVTTGLPEIDYFLSSDLMEPETGQQHYTEQLVRLPNLSIAYEALPSDGNEFSRSALKVSETDTVYICCQSLYKYLPQDDAAFVAIAQRLPGARFVFLGETTSPPGQVFRDRLHAAFRAAGLEPDVHMRMVAPVPFEKFPSFLRLGDAYLDSIGWSGGNTTLEALACHLPVVTMPTELMRGRHTAGILAMTGLQDCISDSFDAYVARAVALASPAANADMRRRIAANVHKLYEDMSAVRALEHFMEDAVARALLPEAGEGYSLTA